MSLNTTRVISALIAGIMIVALLAACGQIEKAKTKNDPEIPVSSSEPEVEVTDEPTVEQTSNQPADTNAPETEPMPQPEQTSEAEAEPEVAEEQNDDNSELYAARAQTIIDSAVAQLGMPFKMGGDSPDEGFDSTGFTYYCVRQAGISFPRELEDQLEYGEKIGYDQIAAGDIVYFSADVGGEAGFCGVYVGGGMIIYSPTPDDFVKTANITTNYWVTHFVTGLRVTHAEN